MVVIALLDRHLPTELTDYIMKILREMIMRDIIEIINYKIVFTLYEETKLSFLVCETQNYYQVLDTNQYGVLV